MTPFQRATLTLLPTSVRLRRINLAVETILSSVELFATVRTMSVRGGGLLMELRAPVAISAPTLEHLRGFIARKLEAVLGLRLRPEQVFLMSLPPAGAAPAQVAGSVELARIVQTLPLWSSAPAAPAAPAAAAAPPAAPAANDPSLLAISEAAAGDVGAPSTQTAKTDKDFFPCDPRLMSRHEGGVDVAELSPSEISQHFDATQPLGMQELPTKTELLADEDFSLEMKAAS